MGRGRRRKINIHRHKAKGLWYCHVGVTKFNDDNGTKRNRPHQFYLGYDEGLAQAAAFKIGAAWEAIKANGGKQWTEEAVNQLAAEGVIGKSVASNYREAIEATPYLRKHFSQKQLEQLAEFTDEDGCIKAGKELDYFFSIMLQEGQHPEVQDKLREDIGKRWRNDPITTVEFLYKLRVLMGQGDQPKEMGPTPVTLNLFAPQQAVEVIDQGVVGDGEVKAITSD